MIETRPKRRLVSRVSGLMLSLVALALAIPAAVTIRRDGEVLRRELERRVVTVAEATAVAASDSLLAGDRDTLARIVATLAFQDREVSSVQITDRTGVTVAHSQPGREGAAVPDLAPPPSATTIEEVAREDGAALIVTAALRLSGRPWGALRVEVPLSRLAAERRAAVLGVIWTGAFVLLIGVAGSALLARSVAHPVERLAGLALRVARGDLAARSDVQGDDEVGALARSFDHMTGELEAATATLREHSASLERRVAERTAALEEKTGLLESREREIADLVANARDPIFVILPDGVLRAANAACEREWGHVGPALVGRPFSEVVCDRGYAPFADVLRAFAAGEPIPEHLEVDVRRPGPACECAPVELALRPVFEPDGRPREIQCVARSLVERREIERRRLEEARLQTAMELAGAAAHELFQPLMGILNSVELLASRKRAPTPAELDRMLPMVRRETERMTEIVRRMQTLTGYGTIPYVRGERIANLGGRP